MRGSVAMVQKKDLKLCSPDDVSNLPDNVGSDGKKKRSKSTQSDISNIKICQRKRQKTRLLSELMGTVQVSLDKQKIQNVSGLRKKNIPKNKKKGKQEVHEKQDVIDDLPMDIVEHLARNQHERQMFDTNSLENCQTQPKVAQVDSAEFSAKGCGINASDKFNTNIKKSLVSKSQQKSLQDHASSSTEAANMKPQELQTQKSSQCHASSEEVPLTLQDLSRRQLQPNLQRPVRPHPRVGVLGPLLQQAIASWSENCQTQPKVAQVDSAEFSAKGCGINASDKFNTNIKKSLVSESQQKSLQDHASSSTEAANMKPQELQTQKSSQCHASSEEVPLTLQDLSRRQLQPNLQRPVRPHPRVGVLGPLLQQAIASWSENYGPQSGMNRNGNYEALNSGMVSAEWSALQLGSVTSVANPEYQLPRYGTGQPSTSGNGKIVHPLDKLVRKDICVTNRNPAYFTVISDKNEYMRRI